MTKNILILSLGFLLLISLFEVVSVSAITDSDVAYFYKYGEPFEIKRECFYNGAHCNQTIFMCFMTVFSPNQTTILNNSQMQGMVNYYNKTIPYTNWPTGYYRTVMSCSDGINSGSEVFYFKLTTTGDGRNDSLFIILSIASILILVLGVVFQNEYIGFIAACLWITLGIYTIIFGFSSLTDMYTRAVGFVSLGLGLIFLLASGYKIAEANDVNAGGIEFDNDW